MVFETKAEPKERPDRSRIEADVETIKNLTRTVDQTTERIMRHARALGYYEPTPEKSAAGAPSPVITTLADALSALDRAIDHCSGSLNVFD